MLLVQDASGIVLCAPHYQSIPPLAGSLAAVPLLLQIALQDPALLALLTLALLEGDGLADFFNEDAQRMTTKEVLDCLLSCLDVVYLQVSSTVCSSTVCSRTVRSCVCTGVVQASSSAPHQPLMP